MFSLRGSKFSKKDFWFQKLNTRTNIMVSYCSFIFRLLCLQFIIFKSDEYGNLELFISVIHCISISTIEILCAELLSIQKGYLAHCISLDSISRFFKLNFYFIHHLLKKSSIYMLFSIVAKWPLWYHHYHSSFSHFSSVWAHCKEIFNLLLLT